MSTTIATSEMDLGPALAEAAPERMSAYFLDLEGLLSRIDSATTYYQVLGVDRTDGQDRIKSSFERMLGLLFPPYAVAMPAETTPRIERAFNKASQAFAALASFSRRREYDGALLSIANKPASAVARNGARVSQPKNEASGASSPANPSTVAAHDDRVTLSGAHERGGVYRESAAAVRPGENRRRCERFKLSVPVRVTGHDRRNGKWNEMAETIDVSRTGVRVRLRRPVKHGTVLYLTLPLPTKLRTHGFAEQSYNVYTLVRRIEPPRQGVRAVGLEFIGERPPAGYLDKPWTVFRPKRWGGNNRRRPDRREQVENVKIEYFDDCMNSISSESVRTENVSRFGLRISGTTAPAEFDLVRVTCPRLRFEGIATLRSRFRGKDGLERICIQLIEKEWPPKG